MARRRSNTYSPAALDFSKFGIDKQTLRKYGIVDPSQLSQAVNIIIAAERAETRRREEYYLDFAKRYLLAVSRALTGTVIETQKEYAKLLAETKAQLTLQSIKAQEITFKELNIHYEDVEVYRRTVEQLGKQGFDLLVYDAAVFQQGATFRDNLGYLARVFQKEIQALVYAALLDAFEESWRGLSEDQFPTEYRDLIEFMIWQLEHKNVATVRATGKSGVGVTGWEVFLDLEKSFGNYDDFREGFHYGALIAGGSGTGKLKERVSLPFRNQPLQNEGTRARIRYDYWRALWSGARMYYPLGATSAKELKSRGATHYDRQVLFHKNKMDELRDKGVNKGFQGLKGDDRTSYINHNAELTRYKQLRKKAPQARGIRIDPGAKQRTIEARVNYWRSKGKAPIWILLEYGQFEFAPRVPPRGVLVRFFKKARDAVSILVRELFNQYVSEAAGYKVGTRGERRLSKGIGGDWLVQYSSNVKPTTKPGGFLPEVIKRSQIQAYDTAKRTALEAEQVSGRFAASATIDALKVKAIQAMERGERAGASIKLYETPLVQRAHGGFEALDVPQQVIVRPSNIEIYNFRRAIAKRGSGGSSAPPIKRTAKPKTPYVPYKKGVTGPSTLGGARTYKHGIGDEFDPNEGAKNLIKAIKNPKKRKRGTT